MSYQEAYELPLPIRKWLITRFEKQKEDEFEQTKKDKNKHAKH